MSAPDIIFAVGSVFFIISLVPSILGPDKPSIWTSVTTGGWLGIFALTYLLLFPNPLWYAGITTLGTSACWFVLAAQKYRERFAEPYLPENIPWRWEGSE